MRLLSLLDRRQRLLVTTILPATALAMVGMFAFESVVVPGDLNHKNMHNLMTLGVVGTAKSVIAATASGAGGADSSLSTTAGHLLRGGDHQRQLEAASRSGAAAGAAIDIEQDTVVSPSLEKLRFGPYNTANTFGACLKIMDDNHWLSEWLGTFRSWRSAG